MTVGHDQQDFSDPDKSRRFLCRNIRRKFPFFI